MAVRLTTSCGILLALAVSLLLLAVGLGAAEWLSEVTP